MKKIYGLLAAALCLTGCSGEKGQKDNALDTTPIVADTAQQTEGANVIAEAEVPLTDEQAPEEEVVEEKVLELNPLDFFSKSSSGYKVKKDKQIYSLLEKMGFKKTGSKKSKWEDMIDYGDGPDVYPMVVDTYTNADTKVVVSDVKYPSGMTDLVGVDITFPSPEQAEAFVKKAQDAGFKKKNSEYTTRWNNGEESEIFYTLKISGNKVEFHASGDDYAW